MFLVVVVITKLSKYGTKVATKKYSQITSQNFAQNNQTQSTSKQASGTQPNKPTGTKQAGTATGGMDQTGTLYDLSSIN